MSYSVCERATWIVPKEFGLGIVARGARNMNETPRWYHRDVPPSRILSTSRRSTARDDSRRVIIDWYEPLFAVAKDPMTRAGDFRGGR